MKSSHVETELLAYLDGELSEQESARVEAHLAACSHCTAELERLRTLRRELEAIFDAALSPVHLPSAADRRILDRLRARAAPHPWRRLWQWRGVFAQALLALVMLVFVFATLRTLRWAPPTGPQETLVLGQDRLAPGSRAALRVIVQDAEKDQPVEGADVVVRVGRTPGLASIVYTGRTDTTGTADVAFTVPEDLEGEASLVVETASTGGADRIVRPITIARDYKLFLSSDKPAYRPGQTIHLRVLALSAADLKPAVGQEIAFAILDPSGGRLAHEVVSTSDFGVGAFDVSLSPDAAHGQYTLQVALGNTISKRTVSVEDYDLPAFSVELETNRSFYRPGDRVSGSVYAAYFFGSPVANSRVILRGYTDETRQSPAVVVQGETNADGMFQFTFILPSSFGQSATDQPVQLDLEAAVVDQAGQREGIRQFLPVAAQPILIRAVPEEAQGGGVKPGVENAVFVLTAYPDGRPAATTLVVEIDGEKRTLATGPYGLAELRYTPTGPTIQLEVQARDTQGAEGHASFLFEGERAPQTLLLRAGRAIYEVGDTLRAEALVAGGKSAVQTVYLDVVHARQTVATLSAPVEDGRAVFALDLTGTMVGTLELHAYAVLSDGGILQDTRLAVVDAPRQVAVAVTADRDQYRPNETAHLQFQTAVSTSDQLPTQPVQAALGIGVVDESVYALEQQPPGFAKAYFLLEQELLERRGRVQGIDLPDPLADAGDEIQAAQDVAARAAWAGAPATDFTLSARSIAEQEAGAKARAVLANRLGLAVALLPLLLSAVTVGGLWRTGVLGRALRRVLIGTLALFLGSPLIALVIGGPMWLLWTVFGTGAPLVVLAVVSILLAGLAVHGWRRRDVRVQLATGLLAAYLVLGGMLVVLAARDGNLQMPLILIGATFLLTVLASATLGQGLVVERRRRAGWATTLLGLMLIPLVIYLSFLPNLTSDLTRVLGDPALYAGPIGWLTGCAPATPTAAPEEPTQMAEEEEQAPTEEPAPTPTLAAAPTEAPTLEPTPLRTPTPPAVEPFPLRQVFPETLYWNAEALTDENGDLALDLPLTDNVTTWRLTALASTREGEIGVATYDLVVFQDFFLDVEMPDTIIQGETVTVTATLYNYLEQAQTVQLDLAPAEWYSLVEGPQQLTVPSNDVAVAQFHIRAEQPGDFSLQVTARGKHVSDAVAAEVTVNPR